VAPSKTYIIGPAAIAESYLANIPDLVPGKQPLAGNASIQNRALIAESIINQIFCN
jgi:hypothetical protein